MQIGHRPTRPAATHRPELCHLRDRRYRKHCKKQELLALFYQAGTAVFIYEIGLKSLKNALSEACEGFLWSAGGFFLVFLPVF